MPLPGNSTLPLLYFFNGSPVNAAVSAFNPVAGSVVIDYTNFNLYQKTSAQGDNSGYNLIATGSGALTPSSIRATGAVTTSSPTAGIGYAAGAGGAVTQITSKATGVTLNKTTGAITLNNAALAAGAEATFTVADTSVLAGDIPVAIHASAGTSGAYGVFCSNIVAATSFDITVSNLSAGSLSEAIVIQFGILRGAIA